MISVDVPCASNFPSAERKNASAVAIDSGKLDVYFGKIDASPGDLVQIGIVPGGPGSPLGDPRSSNLLYEARL